MKLLIDMNLSARWVAAFTAAGIVSIHWSSAGDPLASDQEIAQFANQWGNLCIITSDLDFGTTLAQNHATSPSVIQLRVEDNRPEFALDIVLQAIHVHSANLQRGAIVTVTHRRTRCTFLPL